MFYLLYSLLYLSTLHFCIISPNLTNDQPKEIFVFSTDKNNWKAYEWDKITTIVEFGYHDSELVEFAHERNVKVVGLANFDKKILKSSFEIKKWINTTLENVHKYKLDGVNLDFEDTIECSDIISREGYNKLVYLLSQKLKALNQKYQLSIDVAWSPMNIDNRCYDYSTLATLVDLVFVMAYDERSQIYGKCKAWANSAYQTTLKGIKDHIGIGVKASKIVLGVPWYGYDYPCSNYLAETDTCQLKRVPFRNVTCSDAAGSQIGYTEILSILATSSLPSSFSPHSSSSSSSQQASLKFTSGLRRAVRIVASSWDVEALSPHFTYEVLESGDYHQVWYDNAMSLKIKYLIAEGMKLRGVGFWEADSLRYDDSKESKISVTEMWSALP